jgi:WXG100 family type VII secretion target
MHMSSPGQYSFNFVQAENTISQMQTVSTTLRAMLDDLDTSVKSSLADWNSDASQMYQQCKRDWDAAAAMMPATLDSAQRALSEISSTLSTVERSNASMWSGGGR